MPAVYLLSLGISAGLTGIFGQRALESQGYPAASFGMELVLAGGFASAYIAVQLGYMALLQVLYPTRARAPLFTESLSHLGALAFAPYLLHVPIEWPHPLLFKIEPLIYFGAFCAVHGFFKLVSFYAAITGEPSRRLHALWWLAGCAIALWGAYLAFDTWMGDVTKELPAVTEEVRDYRIGDEFASARLMPEAAPFTGLFPKEAGQGITFRWANLPDVTAEEDLLDTIYVTLVFEGGATKPYSAAVDLKSDGWAEWCVPAQAVPSKADAFTVTWNTQQAPAWRFLSGLRPLVVSHRELLVSGPFFHQRRQESSPLSVVLVAVEGLGAHYLSFMGYSVETTPSLDRLAFSAITFPNAYSPSPEAPAACMTLLTGLSPLRHGYLGGRNGPLQAQYKTLAELLAEKRYATVAFTEGEAEERDLVFGSGFERGFELFDAAYPADARSTDTTAPLPPPDSRVTLQKATAWMDNHAGEQFFVFVRLRELARPTPAARYGEAVQADKKPSELEVYQAALRYVDDQLGSLVKHLRDGEARENACLVIAGAYGLDFSGGPNVPPQRLLSEATLRTPVFLLTPEGRKESRTGAIALEDVLPSLLDFLGMTPGCPTDGRPVLNVPSTKDPVSLMGKPLVLSCVSAGWRFTWASGQLPFAPRTRSEGQVIELYDLTASPKRNIAAKHPELVTRYCDYLAAYLDRYCQTSMP